MPRIYDISRTISTRLAVWPGDTPFSFEPNMSLQNGDAVNLNTLTVTAHVGTHTDAPWHTEPVREHPADMPLAPFLGPARVVTVTRQRGGIVPDDLAAYDLNGVERLLIHTWYSDQPDETFNPAFVYPTVALIDWLAGRGVKLLGVDMPTVDAYGDPDLPGHHRLQQHGIVNLENLLLRDVPDGEYELIALPLKIDEICGSPVRAILRAID